MRRSFVRVGRALFLVTACVATGMAAWAAHASTHSTLGVAGGLLAAMAVAMVIGGAFCIIGLVSWTRASKASPKRPTRPAATSRRR